MFIKGKNEFDIFFKSNPEVNVTLTGLATRVDIKNGLCPLLINIESNPKLETVLDFMLNYYNKQLLKDLDTLLLSEMD